MNKFLKTIFLAFCSLFIFFSFSRAGITNEVINVIKDLSPPQLNRIWIQGEPLKSDTSISSISTINLPFGQNFFTVEFISINYKNQHKLHYAYKLEGLDSNWVSSGNQRRASYANLEPGSYLLKIKVSTDGINWIENTTAVNAVVPFPIWSGWWYKILLVLFIFFLLGVIYKIRVNSAINQVLEISEIRKKESESLRIMMAQDFHDEMGNKLASIIVLVSTLQLLIKEKSKEVEQSLFRIEKASKQLFDGTKSFIWSINPESDRISEIVCYINNFGSELYEHTAIEFSVKDKIDQHVIEKRLSIGYSRQLFFILKEAMTNALVHSNCKNIRLSYSLEKDSNIFGISLEDDGIGVSEEKLSSSRGLNNMKSRASRIGFNLEFFHNPNGGFGVRIDGELPKT